MPKDPSEKEPQSGPEKIVSGFLGKILELTRNPYLASIAILVASLTFSRSILDYATNAVVETSLARESFDRVFVEEGGVRIQEAEVSSQEVNEGRLRPLGRTDSNPDLRDFVLGLKKSSYGERKLLVTEYLKTSGLSVDTEEFLGAYEQYSLGLQDRTGTFFAQIYYYQNILGIFLLLVCKGALVRLLGIRGLILFLPFIYLIFTAVLFFPVEVLLIQGFKILAGSVDYSLNNTAKELLYVPLDLEANLRFKPIIEGPIFKIGSACAALTKLALDSSGILLLGFGSTEILLVLVILVVCFWAWRANRLSGNFSRLTQA